MNLSTARLCLDCNEVYDEGVCPVCGSETFAYLTRWVPSADKRPQPRPANSPTANVYRGLLAAGQSHPRRNAIVGNALLGVAALGTLGWIWQRRGRPTSSDESATGQPPAPSDEKTIPT